MTCRSIQINKMGKVQQWILKLSFSITKKDFVEKRFLEDSSTHLLTFWIKNSSLVKLLYIIKWLLRTMKSALTEILYFL